MDLEVQETHKSPASPGIGIIPGMAPEILKQLSKQFHALILHGNALGGLPTYLQTAVKEITDFGVAVFILSDNVGAGHGVIRIVDQPQVDAIANGVTYLEKANISHDHEVREAITSAVQEGLRGSDLANHVKAQFAYRDGEMPISDLGTEEGLAQFKERVDREMGL